MLKYIQENLEIFLSFEIPEKKEDEEKDHPGSEAVIVDRFKNKN